MIKDKVSKSGEVYHNINQVQNSIETEGMDIHFIKLLKYYLDNAGPNRLIDNSSSNILFHYLVAAFKLAEFMKPFLGEVEIEPRQLNPDSMYLKDRK
jgi:hypothetical protein